MRERFGELILEAQGAYAQGAFDRAFEIYEHAERLASRSGEVELADRAYCLRCAPAIELDQVESLLPRLKQILLASTDRKNRFLAAYYTAVACDLFQDHERAANYAGRATTLALELAEAEAIAVAANLAGTLALRASRFDEAEEAYRTVLMYQSGDEGYRRIMEAQEKDNLGYVLMCTDRVKEGIRLCEEARDDLDAVGADGVGDYLPQTLQDLCYGYLLDDQLDRAEACGERALELAIENDDPLVVKNCLFLLGETAVRRGDAFRARRRLRQLADYYPEVAVSDEVVDLLLATDMTSVVNLRG